MYYKFEKYKDKVPPEVIQFMALSALNPDLAEAELEAMPIKEHQKFIRLMLGIKLNPILTFIARVEYLAAYVSKDEAESFYQADKSILCEALVKHKPARQWVARAKDNLTLVMTKPVNEPGPAQWASAIINIERGALFLPDDVFLIAGVN